MKSFSKLMLFMALGAGIFSSCSNESPWEAGTTADGKIAINLLTDGSVLTGTRASDSESPLVPGASEFSISLVSTDGSYKNSWSSLDGFNKEAGFPMGSYLISANYGNLDDEGFTNPYFYGESQVSVSLGKESNANITAKLANSMVSIRYSDEFGDYFTGFSATTQTTGHSPVVFAQNESRPAYITPGMVNLGLTLTNSASQTVTLTPSNFEAQPQHHYIVTFGVEGNINNDRAMLTVTWSEEVVEETKEIFLTDEMFTKPAPEIKANGFTSDDQISVFEGIGDDAKNPEFHVFAFGGMEKATLTIVASDNGSVPPCGGSVELFNADDATQANLKASGIECVGFWGSVGEMAVINLKDLLRTLIPGTYTITLDIEDSLGRHPSEENNVILNIKVEGIEYQFTGYKKPDFLDDEIEVVISTNCENLKEELTFYALDQNSEFQNASFTYLNDTTEPTVLTNLPYHYAYKLTLPESIIDSKWKVRTQLANKTMREMEVEVNMPVFTVETDAFAKKVKLRILVPDDSKWDAQTIVNNAKIYNGNTQITQGITCYPEDRIIEVTRIDGSNAFSPGNTYNGFSLSLGKTLIESYKNNVNSFTTEKDTNVPNGDFESLIQYFSGTINQGGTWSTSPMDFGSNYQNTATFTIHEPTGGWATTNQKTMSGTTNTWFKQPSVFNASLSYSGYCTGVAIGTGRGSETPDSYKNFNIHGGTNAMVIRNVAWDDTGSVPSKDDGIFGKVKGTKDYYNTKVPEVKNKSVGKMFLGYYSYSNGEETYKEGISFESRPSALTGWYTYKNDSQDSEDFGTVVATVYYNDEVIATGNAELHNCIDYAQFNIPLNYSQFGKNATKISIMVTSSKYASTKMEDETANVKVSTYNSPYESYQHGATLVVDDFEFVY